MDTQTIPLRTRRDGWTPARQQAFLAALADTACVATAAARVGMSRASAYKLRRHPATAAFRAAWDAALAPDWSPMAPSAVERAIAGKVAMVEDGGVPATRRRPCSPRLMIRMIDRAARAHRQASEKRPER